MAVYKVPDDKQSTHKQRIRFSIAVALAILGAAAPSSYSHAATTTTPSEPVASATTNAVNVGGDGPTRLVVDAKNNIIRIMIAGKEVGRFDKSGLHVEGDFTHSGMDETTGPAKVSGDGHAQ